MYLLMFDSFQNLVIAKLCNYMFPSGIINILIPIAECIILTKRALVYKI